MSLSPAASTAFAISAPKPREAPVIIHIFCAIALSPLLVSEASVGKVSSWVQLFFGDPLLQESGTIPKLSTFALASCKKSYNIAIDEHDFRKVENCSLAFVPDQLLDRTNMFGPNSPAHA
jgi:hypothetical protein